jgi:ribonuclease HIII
MKPLQRSMKLTLQEIERLGDAVAAARITPSPLTSEYELLRVVQGKISIIVYRSGKMVYEDNDETMDLVGKVLYQHNAEYAYELGSDEAGKGEWYGPLVVVCVAVKSENMHQLRRIGIKDSKSISPRGIKIIANELKKNKHVIWKQKLLRPTEYNSRVKSLKEEGRNLNDLLAWAHSVVIREALDEVQCSQRPGEKIRVTIDMFSEEKTILALHGLDKTNVTIVQKIGGEEDVAVAAASILAKSLFEEEVDRMWRTFGIDLRIAKPADIPIEILDTVAKMHFRNVKRS